jgi:hypothetical protein
MGWFYRDARLVALTAALASDSLHRLHARFVASRLAIVDGIEQISAWDAQRTLALLIDAATAARRLTIGRFVIVADGSGVGDAVTVGGGRTGGSGGTTGVQPTAGLGGYATIAY